MIGLPSHVGYVLSATNCAFAALPPTDSALRFGTVGIALNVLLPAIISSPVFPTLFDMVPIKSYCDWVTYLKTVAAVPETDAAVGVSANPVMVLSAENKI